MLRYAKRIRRQEKRLCHKSFKWGALPELAVGMLGVRAVGGSPPKFMGGSVLWRRKEHLFSNMTYVMFEEADGLPAAKRKEPNPLAPIVIIIILNR
jgi:hypothetical protein